MVKKWDGTERRVAHEQREGRRIGDQRCPDHHLLWPHHDKDTEEHRSLVCTKLADIKAALAREIRRLVVAALYDSTLGSGLKLVGVYEFRVLNTWSTGQLPSVSPSASRSPSASAS